MILQDHSRVIEKPKLEENVVAVVQLRGLGVSDSTGLSIVGFGDGHTCIQVLELLLQLCDLVQDSSSMREVS